MTRYEFSLVDVFADTPLTGSSLAVVHAGGDPDSDAVASVLGPAVAREFQQAETTFVLPPLTSQGSWRLRCWTAAGAEVFGAGHNAMGAWWRIAERGDVALTGARTTFWQEIGTQVLPLVVEAGAGGPEAVAMRQGEPVTGAIMRDTDALRRALGVEAGSVVGPPTVVSTGAAHLLVPIRDRRALDSLRVDSAALLPLLADVQAEGCYVYTTEPVDRRVASARFVNPTVGIIEDPATGTAAGPLAAHLVEHGLAPAGEDLVIVQGEAMGRPSQLTVRVDQEGVTISGRCVTVATGWLTLPEV
jgi:trans-2,3-dihydro-3-hydroxyanthranilate isomerase